ncbi:uncharacterized protein [Watersipora subatra]|uniref:uncharacterized protein n=1 Tax=Watersipora subatra TaxID=2589382 RepID=UPI00355BDCD1
MVDSCFSCQEHSRAKSLPTAEPFEVPEYPMQYVAAYIFNLNDKEYLVTVDRYSKWPDCYELKNANSRTVIELLQRQFANFGKPEILLSDNAPQYSSYEFRCFVEENGIKHITSSPYFSRANELAEHMNQTIKSSLRKALETGQTLLDVSTTIRSTPLGDWLPTPAVLVQSKNLRNKLHFCAEQLRYKNLNAKNLDILLRKRQDQDVFGKASNKTTAMFSDGEHVWCRVGHRQWLPAKIIDHAGTPHSFHVELEGGKVDRRNQSFFRARKLNLLRYDVRSMPRTSGNSGLNGKFHRPASSAPTATTTPSETVPTSAAHITHNANVTVTRSGRVSKPPI